MNKQFKPVKLSFLGIIFAIVGLVTGIIGFFSMKSSIDFKNNAVEIIGIISNCETSRDSDGDTHYTFYVDYTYDGESYEGVRLSSSSSSWDVGDELKLLIDTRNPNRVDASSFLFFVPLICFFFTICFGGVGTSLTIKSIKRSNEMKNLIKNGKKIYIEIVGVEEDYSTTINGRHPLRLVCNLEDDKGFIYEARSDGYMNIPINLEGRFVAVYIDYNDSSKYFIDVNDIRN